MAVLNVSTTEFRRRQAHLLDMADKGTNVLIRRGRKFYRVVPYVVDDDEITPTMYAKIDEALAEVEEGKVRSFSSIAELDKYIDSL